MIQPADKLINYLRLGKRSEAKQQRVHRSSFSILYVLVPNLNSTETPVRLIGWCKWFVFHPQLIFQSSGYESRWLQVWCFSLQVKMTPCVPNLMFKLTALKLRRSCHFNSWIQSEVFLMAFLSVDGSAFQCTCKCNRIEWLVLRHPCVEDPRNKSAAPLVSAIYLESSTCSIFLFYENSEKYCSVFIFSYFLSYFFSVFDNDPSMYWTGQLVKQHQCSLVD